MPEAKTAVDKTTKDYWADYFGPYGKQFTQDVPRRVAAAVAKAIKTASPVTKATIAPLGCAPTATGGLTFEGIFRGLAGKETVLRAFKAELDGRGELTDIKQLAI